MLIKSFFMLFLPAVTISLTLHAREGCTAAQMSRHAAEMLSGVSGEISLHWPGSS